MAVQLERLQPAIDNQACKEYMMKLSKSLITMQAQSLCKVKDDEYEDIRRHYRYSWQ
jgi:hypothetical protein